MPPSVELRRRLRWADADPAGQIYFPRIFEVIEEAEHELLRRVKWSIDVPSPHYEFPRVNINCNFLRTIILGSSYRVRLVVGRVGGSSIRYDYQVFDADEQLAIDGTMTVVMMKDSETFEIPSDLRKALES